MLQLSASLINRSVMSLRTTSIIATTLRPIINPNNLKIEGFYCQDHLERRQPILLTQDIRDMIPQGFVVNDYEVLTDPEELIRLKEVLSIDFNILGKTVVTTSKTRLGKVTDFSTDSQSFYIQKFYVSQPIYKSLNGGQLGIERNQVVEITNKHIIVKDPLQPTRVAVTATASPA